MFTYVIIIMFYFRAQSSSERSSPDNAAKARRSQSTPTDKKLKSTRSFLD